MTKLIVTILSLLFSFNADARMCPGNIGGTGAAGDVGGNPCDTEVQSCATTTNQTDSVLGSTYRWKAGKFVATDTATICKIALQLKKVGSPTFTITASIYGSTGTEPDESNIIGTSDPISASGLSTSYPSNIVPGDWAQFSGISADIANTTEYWIVLTASAVGDASNYIHIRTDTGCDYEDGVKFSSNGTSWTGSDSGRSFKNYLYE